MNNTIIIDFNFLVNANLRRLANKDTCDFYQFLKYLSQNFILKIYSDKKKPVEDFLIENRLIDYIADIVTETDTECLYIDIDSMQYIDYIVESYIEAKK